MRTAAQVIFAYLLLLVAGAVWRLLPLGIMTPDLVSLFAAYLGLTARDKLAPSLAGAVLIGYLADVLYGTPVGLMAFCAGLLCGACHFAQERLLVRGTIFTVSFAFLAAFAVGLLALLIRSTAGYLPAGWSAPLWDLSSSAFLTGILGPFVFRGCRYVDSRFARTRRERDVAASGLMW